MFDVSVVVLLVGLRTVLLVIDCLVVRISKVRNTLVSCNELYDQICLFFLEDKFWIVDMISK